MFGKKEKTVFEKVKDTEYLKNLKILSMTVQSLVNTMQEMQIEYEKTVNENNHLKEQLHKYQNKE